MPVYNAAAHRARRAGEYLGAVRHQRFGHCYVCGRWGPWLYRRRVIPPKLEAMWGLTPEMAAALARKESNDCAWCGAKLRAQRLARVLLDEFPDGSPPAPSKSVRAWSRTSLARSLRIAEINRIEGLHDAFKDLPGLADSDFADLVKPGATHHGVRSEDLTRLTYPDASFDLVLTSETLEHVPDLGAALAEVRRVLRPGGTHLFTVPLLPDVPATYARAEGFTDDERDSRALVLRHPGGDSGYPVFTEFGADLTQILERAGFRTEVRFGPPRVDDLAQVFVCRKV